MPFLRLFLDRLTAGAGAPSLAHAASLARFFAMGLAAIAASALVSPASSEAQQWMVDDAAITESGACQIEAWWGETERWMLPACTLVPRTEITLGTGWFDRGADQRALHGFAQVKVLGRDAEGTRWGWGAVVGASRSGEGEGGAATQIAAYVPVTVNVQTLPLVLHLNTGWALERETHIDHAHTHRGVLWGMRGDFTLSERLGLVAEVSGLSGEAAEAQAGLRLAVVPDRLTMDLSYGVSRDRAEDGLGFQVGLAWTPAPFRSFEP